MSTDYDVVVIGAGPVGLSVAGFLGRYGWKVGVFDQETSMYPLPRAGHVDSEIMRLLQILGCAHDFVDKAVPLREGVFINAAGEVLARLPLLVGGSTGWHSDYLLYQPDFDDALRSVLDELADVQIQRGRKLIGLEQTAEGVTANFRAQAEERLPDASVTARYLIGADGANSFVRTTIDSPWTDLGFEERWLVVNMKPHDADADLDLPGSGQICDPARPTSLFRWLGREHVRLEFMLHASESTSIRDDEDTSWAMVEKWGLTRANSTFVRRAVYTFRSCIAEQWVHGKVVLAGDAAHLMPPFLGQGMCSGIRDAANLSWKLDLVMRGLAQDDLLNSYQAERASHVRALIETSVEAGKIVCVTDPEAAKQRDAALRGLSGDALPPPPSLHGGIEHLQENGTPGKHAGVLSMQGRLRKQGTNGLLGDLLPPTWLVLSNHRIDPAIVSPDLQSIPVRVLQVTPAPTDGDDSATDLDGVYESWFSEMQCSYVIVRPDLYVYGATNELAELKEMLEGLEAQILGRHSDSAVTV